MYLDFEDYRPEFSPVGRAISLREGVLIAFIVHLLMVIFVLVSPRLFPERDRAARLQALLQQRAQQQPRFVFVQPRRDLAAPKPPDRAEASDKDRMARSPLRAPNPTNPLPSSRGNSPERVEADERQAPRGEGAAPNAAAGQQAQAARPPERDAQASLTIPKSAPENGSSGHAAAGGGALGEALKNLGRYVQRDQFDNPGGQGQPGATIQFDTKGVEFGPWIRRFVAQVKRNWFVPYAAMSMRGHVVITFNVHKDGSITDLTVIGPCPIEAFNNAAFGALVSSNPTYPLPPEYPSEKAFFTVTFYYNEIQQ